MTDLFVNYRSEIQKENHHFAFADTRKDAITICEELNRVYEENTVLRLENSRLSHDLFWANKEVEELKEEIETQNLNIWRLREKITDCKNILKD